MVTAIEIIGLDGKLDVLTSPELRQALAGHVEAGRSRIILDLSSVDDIDSSGLAAIVAGVKQARQVGGDIRLVRPQRPRAMRVFDLTNFDQILKMGSSADALADAWATP